MIGRTGSYAARLDIDYPQQLDRLTTLLRPVWALPILIVLALVSRGAGSPTTVVTEVGETVSQVASAGGGVLAGLAAATMLMIVFRKRYPRRLFDYVVGVNRWALRVQAYATLLVTDRYPPFSLR